ncbi:hypothetical protein TNCV_1106101 [Trichonephila clavipes]|nr:hypothetical protein TNCV_1106101 [Trichonephila clavipes]
MLVIKRNGQVTRTQDQIEYYWVFLSILIMSPRMSCSGWTRCPASQSGSTSSDLMLVDEELYPIQAWKKAS